MSEYIAYFFNNIPSRNTIRNNIVRRFQATVVIIYQAEISNKISIHLQFNHTIGLPVTLQLFYQAPNQSRLNKNLYIQASMDNIHTVRITSLSTKYKLNILMKSRHIDLWYFSHIYIRYVRGTLEICSLF